MVFIVFYRLISGRTALEVQEYTQDLETDADEV
jgi:hypothetical protein